MGTTILKTSCEYPQLSSMQVYCNKDVIAHGIDSVGHMKYVLGNVRIDQGRMDDAFTLHKSARDCWLVTFGKEHHKTGDAWHKVGWHLCRMERWEEAR